MVEDKHLIFYVSKEFETTVNGPTIHIQILPVGPIFSFVELNEPTNYNNYDPYFYSPLLVYIEYVQSEIQNYRDSGSEVIKIW